MTNLGGRQKQGCEHVVLVGTTVELHQILCVQRILLQEGRPTSTKGQKNKSERTLVKKQMGPSTGVRDSQERSSATIADRGAQNQDPHVFRRASLAMTKQDWRHERNDCHCQADGHHFKHPTDRGVHKLGSKPGHSEGDTKQRSIEALEKPRAG